MADCFLFDDARSITSPDTDTQGTLRQAPAILSNIQRSVLRAIQLNNNLGDEHEHFSSI